MNNCLHMLIASTSHSHSPMLTQFTIAIHMSTYLFVKLLVLLIMVVTLTMWYCTPDLPTLTVWPWDPWYETPFSVLPVLHQIVTANWSRPSPPASLGLWAQPTLAKTRSKREGWGPKTRRHVRPDWPSSGLHTRAAQSWNYIPFLSGSKSTRKHLHIMTICGSPGKIRVMYIWVHHLVQSVALKFCYGEGSHILCWRQIFMCP